MKKAIILYISGIVGIFLLCVYLMTNGKVPVFDATNNIVYTTTYLETGSAIALLVGLLAFLTSIFTNYHTNSENEKNILLQLKQNKDFLMLDLNKKDMKEAILKLKILITKLSFMYSLSHDVEGDYKYRIFCLYRAKEEQDWFRLLPNTIENKIDDFLKEYMTKDVESIFSTVLISFIVDGEDFIKSEILDKSSSKYTCYEENKKCYIEMKEICNEIELKNGQEINTFIYELLEDLAPDKIHHLIQNEFINDL